MNLWTYCNNNPIMYVDPDGNFIISLTALIVGTIAGATIGFATAAYIDYKDDGQIFNGSVKWYDYLGATILGGVIGAVVGVVASGIAGMSFSISLPTFGFVNSGGALSIGITGSISLTVSVTQVLTGAGLLGLTSMLAKGFGPRMGHNQHEKQQWKEAMRRLNITDKDLMTRLHNEIHKYPYQDKLRDLVDLIIKILEEWGL